MRKTKTDTKTLKTLLFPYPSSLSCDLLAPEPPASRSTLPQVLAMLEHLDSPGNEPHLGKDIWAAMECVPSTVLRVSRSWIKRPEEPFQLSQWEQGWCPALDIGSDFKDLIQFPAVLQIFSVILDKVFLVVSGDSQPDIYL